MSDSQHSVSTASASVDLFQRINAICALVNEVTDEKELLEESLRQTMSVFGAHRGSIFICKEESGNELVLSAVEGMPISDQKAMVKRMGEGVVGRVAANKQPIVVEDISNDERFKNYKARKSYKTPSFICTPLLVKDKLLGVINITDKHSGHGFSKEELQLLDFLATQIALNYQRVKLHEKFKKIVQESQTLRDELGRSSQEADILKKQVLVQERLASIGKLAGGIAHEFNNPLDGVMRYTNLCLDHLGDEEIVRNYLLEVKNGLNRMAGIVKSLLACSRSSELASQKIDINRSIELAVKDLQAEILHKNIKITKSLTRGLPLILDLGLDRIAINLIRNAVDAIEKEGVIRVKTAQKDDDIIFEVEDSGCGIESERISQIFEPFYTTKDIGRGCGLGLTIVSEIVKNYNGDIHVESKPGDGTKFIVRIPRTI